MLNLESMEDVAAKALGMDLLGNDSTLGAAETRMISDACERYFDMLSRQGINRPYEEDDESDHCELPLGNNAISMVSRAVIAVSSIQSNSLVLEKVDDSDAAAVSAVPPEIIRANLATNLEVANSHMAHGNNGVYLDHMEASFILEHAKADMRDYALLCSGAWIDTANPEAAISTLDMCQGNATGHPPNSGSERLFMLEALPNGSAVNSALQGGKVSVVGIVKGATLLAVVAERWAKRYPESPSDDQMKDAQHYQDYARWACREALSVGIQAKHAFSDFSYQAKHYQQRLDDLQGSLRRQREDEIQLAQQQKAKLTDIPSSVLDNPPNFPRFDFFAGLNPGGDKTGSIEKSKEIEQRLQSKLVGFEIAMRTLHTSYNYCIDFQNRTQTWVRLVGLLSQNLAPVSGFLTGSLLQDPYAYQKFISINRTELRSRTEILLRILRERAPAPEKWVAMSSMMTNEYDYLRGFK
jgi:hypothetical protein